MLGHGSLLATAFADTPDDDRDGGDAREDEADDRLSDAGSTASGLAGRPCLMRGTAAARAHRREG
jgi:hypothetical protein